MTVGIIDRGELRKVNSDLGSLSKGVSVLQITFTALSFFLPTTLRPSRFNDNVMYCSETWAGEPEFWLWGS